jgi:hypothetical protein
MNDQLRAGKAHLFDVVPELAMLQSFSSGPTFRGLETKNPARFAPAGFGIRVVPDPTAHCRRRPPHARRPPRLARFLVGSKSSWMRSLGTCCVEKLMNLYKHRFSFHNGFIFIHENCAKITFRLRMKTKNPAGARFLSGLRLVAASTLYYVNAKSIRDRENAQFQDGF